MGVLSFRAPLKFAASAEHERNAPLALAIACWFMVVAVLFVVWLSLPTREESGATCESFGRGGEHCLPAPAPVSECLSLGRGGRLCAGR
jgi:hypothetical protein